MLWLLFFMFVTVPIIEIAVFLQVGKVIGVAATIGIVIVTAILGSALLRIQGFAVLNRVQQSLARGEVPVTAAIDGMSLLVAGALLLTPGFVTDAIGLALFVPPLRRALARALVDRAIRSGRLHASVHPGSGRRPAADQGTIIDAEYETVSDTDRRGGNGADGAPGTGNGRGGDSPWRRP